MKARASQGCPHAKGELERLENYAASLNAVDDTVEEDNSDATEEEEGCGCDKADRKNSENNGDNKKNESKEQTLPKPDSTYPDKRYNEEILIPKG